MFGLGITEIIVIVLVVLLAVKPEDLPNFFKKVGKSYNELKKTASDVKEMKDDFMNIANNDIENEADDTKKKNDLNRTNRKEG